MTDILPPANPNALGLHVTDEEWRLLLELLAAEPTIIEARVYGSRQTGFRREKPEPKPLDLDIAITVRSGDPDDRVLEFWLVSERLEKNAWGCGLLLQVEDLTDSKSPNFSKRQAGVRIYP